MSNNNFYKNKISYYPELKKSFEDKNLPLTIDNFSKTISEFESVLSEPNTAKTLSSSIKRKKIKPKINHDRIPSILSNEIDSIIISQNRNNLKGSNIRTNMKKAIDLLRSRKDTSKTTYSSANKTQNKFSNISVTTSIKTKQLNQTKYPILNKFKFLSHKNSILNNSTENSNSKLLSRNSDLFVNDISKSNSIERSDKAKILYSSLTDTHDKSKQLKKHYVSQFTIINNNIYTSKEKIKNETNKHNYDMIQLVNREIKKVEKNTLDKLVRLDKEDRTYNIISKLSESSAFKTENVIRAKMGMLNKKPTNSKIKINWEKNLHLGRLISSLDNKVKSLYNKHNIKFDS